MLENTCIFRKSIMELYMMNRPHGRMILASVEKGPLVWPSITEDGVTRLKEYVELTPAEAIQADCDIKAINIILQGLPTEIYALIQTSADIQTSSDSLTHNASYHPAWSGGYDSDCDELNSAKIGSTANLSRMAQMHSLRTAHSSYIKHTQEEALVLRDIVEHVKANYPQDPLLESAFRYTKVIQDLLSHISRSCPSINNCGSQLIEAIPRKKDKKLRFAESLTSSENTKPASTSNIVSNKRVLHSTGVRLSTSASGSQPSGKTKNDDFCNHPSLVIRRIK
ncbi:hypothetical protein Tco_0278461 [Tanacetum coccineum]